MEFNLKYDPYKTIMENELGRDEAEPAFYYQGDHLGSSAYLTDEAGAITQTLNYLPYGEDWVDVHNNPHYLSRYKYNGKEKDPESGLHYYGARYYDSDISQWLSIDPMADKYPSLSPYNYCADNPVILVDPDGREITNFLDEKGNLISTQKDGSNAVFKLHLTAGTLKGSGGNAYFEFSHYDESLGGINSIDIGTVIDEAQHYAMDNYKSDGKVTYCNFAAEFIVQSFTAAAEAAGYNVFGNEVVKGTANDIYRAKIPTELKLKNNDQAFDKASNKKGENPCLVLGVIPGHVLTFMRTGAYANIGGSNGNTEQTSGWLKYHKNAKFFFIDAQKMKMENLNVIEVKENIK